jgi:hypothetical protein
MTVLLLGVRADLLETVQQELHAPDIEFLGGTGVADVRPAFRQADIDHVIIGGGLDLEARAAMVREVFQSSDRATVHMKDQMSGPRVPAVCPGRAGRARRLRAPGIARRDPAGRAPGPRRWISTVPAGGASPFHAEPFQVRTDPAVIGDLRARVRNARLPEAAPGEPWAQGTDRNWLAGLLKYWAEGFDWQAAERELNAFAHYRARISGTVVHFVHEKARSGHGIPLILGHGWPSCFAELLPLVPLLTDPAAHGIGGPAFDVVIPSLPGYGFSLRPDVAGGPRPERAANLRQQARSAVAVDALPLPVLLPRYSGLVPDSGDLLSCSFCGKSQKQVRKLIAGPRVYICDGCLGRVHAVIAGHGRTASTPIATIQQVSDEGGAEQCSFCGKQRHQVAAMASAGDARICNECLELCDEIVEESPAPSR